MDNAGMQPPLVISPADLDRVETKTPLQSASSHAAAPQPVSHVAPRSTNAVLWVVVPAVLAVMASFGLLTVGGVTFLLLFSGSSDEISEPAPYTAYSSSSYASSSDPYSTTSDSYAAAPYVPVDYSYSSDGSYSSGSDTYATDSGYSPATYTEPTYVEPSYSAPTYVEPAATETAWTDPASSGETTLWNFSDPESDLVAAIERDEEELVGMDAAILAARVGETAGGVEAQNGETAADQIVGMLFSVGADAVEQQLLAERAVVQARLDANRAELSRLRGY